MTQQGGETGIPILTEVIQAPVYGVDLPERRTRTQPLPPAPAPPTVPAPAALPGPVATTLPTPEAESTHEIDAGRAQPFADSAAHAATATDQDSALPSGGLGPTTDDDIAAFERIAASVRTQVLQQLLDRADATLDQRIRNSLTDILQEAVTQLTTQLRQSLQQTLEALVDDLVADAIARELPNRTISKNKK